MVVSIFVMERFIQKLMVQNLTSREIEGKNLNFVSLFCLIPVKKNTLEFLLFTNFVITSHDQFYKTPKRLPRSPIFSNIQTS